MSALRFAWTGAAGMACLVSVAAWGQAPKALAFCVGSDAEVSRVGIPVAAEMAVARALARGIGADARFVQLPPHDESPEQAVLAERCDAAVGVIDDPDLVAAERPPAGIALTDPYYAAGYLLIRRREVRPVRALGELGEARVGVEKESIVAYSLRQRGQRVHVLPDYDAVVRAMVQHRLDYGYLWGPLAAQLLRGRNDVVLVQEFVPVDRWNFALAVREREGGLRRELNAAIQSLAETHVVPRAFAAHGAPFLPPCAASRSESCQIRTADALAPSGGAPRSPRR